MLSKPWECIFIESVHGREKVTAYVCKKPALRSKCDSDKRSAEPLLNKRYVGYTTTYWALKAQRLLLGRERRAMDKQNEKVSD